MLIESLHLTNLLSFGPKAEALRLGSLNVLIGPNGAGKSNLLEAIGLLQAAPQDFAKAIRSSGSGVRDWIWKGTKPPASGSTSLRAEVRGRNGETLRYGLTFAEVAQRFELIEEFVDTERPMGLLSAQTRVPLYQLADSGAGLILANGARREIVRSQLAPNQSILAQRRDPDLYPELSELAHAFDRIRIYRDWSFGRNTPARRPQDAALPNEYLAEDCSNLGLVLNRLRRDPPVREQLLTALRVLYDGIDGYDVAIEGGTVQVFFEEAGRIIPATRLSDGTLRYLCLLAILCHPDPPPLICIEEPELGLHPDLLPTLAELLRNASERTQLIVTTHSEVLVDALTETPDAVIVIERGEGGTTARRLDKDLLQPWLANYRLGQLWSRGDLGGNRW